MLTQAFRNLTLPFQRPEKHNHSKIHTNHLVQQKQNDHGKHIYKTPGVYVEEIVKLPPSVAEVETAIPAFVGYTEKAKRYVDDDLINIPTRITSLLEYEQYFGKGPAYNNIHVRLTLENAVDSDNTTVSNSIYNLYQSMQLFFDNGGGNCYVSSAGKYSDNDNVATRAANLKTALNEVRKYDEPTLLLSPMQ